MSKSRFLKEKWVRIMGEWCSSGLWDRHGANVGIDYLPVSKELQERISYMQKVYDAREACTDGTVPGSYADLVDDWLVEEELKIAIEVKKQLPTWSVFVFNSGAFDLKQNEFYNSHIYDGVKFEDIKILCNKNSKKITEVDFSRVDEGRLPFYIDDSL